MSKDGRVVRRAALVACILWASTPALSADIGDEATGAFLRDSEFVIHPRSYYLSRERPAPTTDLGAWALGGWLGYQSGWFMNTLRLGVSGYTSQKLWGPSDKDGTLLLAPGQEGYSVWGQAYVSLKLWDQVFTGYRQLVDQPEVNLQDNRMTPNTFQGYTLAGKVAGLGYFAGYLDKMKTRNSDTFRDFATVAGAPAGVQEGMWIGGVTFAPSKELALRLSSYHVDDVLASTYTDVNWSTPLAKDTELRLGAQYMYQTSVGSDLLTGSDFSVGGGGLKADLKWQAAIFTLVYTQMGRGQAWRSPYGSWPGYTGMIVEDFDRAGEKAWLIGASYDFARHGLPGLSAFANFVFGHGAINAATDASLSDKTEYDFTVDYRFTGDWPQWLKPLWIRGRVVRVEEKLSGSTGVTHDYRVIVNYEWVFK